MFSTNPALVSSGVTNVIKPWDVIQYMSPGQGICSIAIWPIFLTYELCLIRIVLCYLYRTLYHRVSYHLHWSLGPFQWQVLYEVLSCYDMALFNYDSWDPQLISVSLRANKLKSHEFKQNLMTDMSCPSTCIGLFKYYANQNVPGVTGLYVRICYLGAWHLGMFPCLLLLGFLKQYPIRADSRLVPSQWETSLQSNAVSHWLDTNLESALPIIQSNHSKTTP